ncbi:MAG: hypothetical protein O2971_13095 [Proteobacteria bacterium]|nr:hypothetical protein [Pseudomonadota bacterium]
MNWDAIGAVGEIVGALAVILSLLYLSSQVRQTNKLANNNSLQAVLQSEMNFASIIMENAEIWDRLLAGESFEGREDNRKAIILFNLYLLDSSARYNQYITGYLDQPNWESRKATLREFMNLPIFEQWRTSLGARGHAQNFLEVIDNIRSDESDIGLASQEEMNS